MVPVSPHASVRAPALPKPYSPPASPSNTLAVIALTGRVAPRAELAALLESPAGRDLHASAVAVIVALWSWASAEGVAWPSAESIARRAHVSRRAVFYALDQLEAAGFVVRCRPSLPARRRRRESNTYQLASAASLPQVPRAESPCPPRRVAPTRTRPAPSSSPSPAAEPVRVIATPLPSSRPAPAEPPAFAVRSAAPHQVQPLRAKGPGENRKENARGGAQVREATAPPGDRLGASPEATAAKRLTRAERSARNRAAWRERQRPSASATRAPAPRRAPAYQARDEQAPDPRDALAALRAWRATHQPALGREPARESASPAPVLDVRRPDLAQRAPIALGGLLGAFARVPLGPHVGSHGSPRPCSSPARPSRSPAIGAPPYPEARSTPLWSPHPRR